MDAAAQAKIAAYRALEAAVSACAGPYPKLARKLLDLLDEIAPVRFSPDYASGRVHGADYKFTRQEAAVVKLLHAQAERGTPWMLSASVLKAINSDQRKLSAVFRHRTGPNPFWARHVVTEGERCRVNLDAPDTLPILPKNLPPRPRRNR